jgi:hypothetical protein
MPAFSVGDPVTSLFRTMMLSETFNVVVLIVSVSPVTVRLPTTVTLPPTVKEDRVPRDVKLDAITFDARAVPERLAALARFATACPAVQVNRESIALIAAFSVVPQPESPFTGSDVVPSIKYATEISVSDSYKY